jgi:hypothetical protein
MTFAFDPDVAVAIEAMADKLALVTGAPRGDWKALRDACNSNIASMESRFQPSPTVTITDYTITTDDGSEIAARWYTHEGSPPGSAVVYV